MRRPSAAAMAGVPEARCVPELVARNHACFERHGSGQDLHIRCDGASPKSRTSVPLEALTDSILSF